ncbi:hypothetical protein EJ04DRAFT_504275 [Polyplosphaeria fusca]|uniref:DUF6536 domain-containing protein n=1 Tax=Polyplosphaeria fusca TaxID=682080 RepID=A0A9P4QJ77_9PLEO|nr:hypothetical protein EJ04DRAFT_504275 [Polyplosphaeria fusca]
MAQPLSLIKGFFASDWQPKTQEIINLQFLVRMRNERLATSAASIKEDDNLECGARPQHSKLSHGFLYLLFRSIKVVGSAWDDRFPGWHSGIAGFTILTSILLVLNICALAWTATHRDDGHYATFAVGSYQSISNISGWIHFSIDILSTALLAGSNYCMQCLSSPTRAEVDAAHARGSYLNIGTLSWRNVSTSRKRRICLLSLLTLSSVAIHPIYTSALVTPGLEAVSHADFRAFSQQTPSLMTVYQLGQHTERLRYIQNITTSGQIRDPSLWYNISASECANYETFQTERSTLLIVVNETIQQIFATQDPRLVPYGSTVYSHLLPSFLRHPIYPVYPIFHKGEKNWASTSQWHTRISYCLSRKVPARCRLQINLWFLLTATVLNAIKLSCLLFTFKEQQEPPLVTTGDAIASFLSSRCVHSAGMCLLSQEELTRGKRWGSNEVDVAPTFRRFETRRLRYYHSVSFSRWIYGVIKKQFETTNTDYSLQSLWNMGLGKLDEHSLTKTTLCSFFLGGHDQNKWAKCGVTYGGVSAMIFTSLPQLYLSAIYLSLNHQLTLMIQLRDWARLASHRQAIRVSSPEPYSDQVSTYWLSLPYLYSIPLLLTRISLGWLVSQSLFIVRYVIYEDLSIDDASDVSYTMGFSAIALIYSFIFGLVIFGVSVAIGFCKCTVGMPLGPQNSLVIAAACHPPETDRYAAKKMVKWGAIPTGDTEEASLPHHCTITSRRVENPLEGRWYE